jgi:hypothetical protein
MRLRNSLIAALVLFLAMASCSGDEPLPPGVTTTRAPPPPPPSPREVREVEKCDDLVPVGVSFVENMVEALGGLPVGVLRGEDPLPPDVVALEVVGRELDERAARLGCDVNGLNSEIVVGVAEIDSDEPVVALFLDIIRSGIISPLPTVPVATTEAP